MSTAVRGEPTRESVVRLDVDLGEVAHRDVGEVAGAVAGAVGCDLERRVGTEGESDVVAVGVVLGLVAGQVLDRYHVQRDAAGAGVDRGHLADEAGNRSRRAGVGRRCRLPELGTVREAALGPPH